MTTRTLIALFALLVGTTAKSAPYLHCVPVAETDGVDYYEVRVDKDDKKVESSVPKDLGGGMERLSYDIAPFVGSGVRTFDVRGCSELFGCGGWSEPYEVGVNPPGVLTGLILKGEE